MAADRDEAPCLRGRQDLSVVLFHRDRPAAHVTKLPGQSESRFTPIAPCCCIALQSVGKVQRFPAGASLGEHFALPAFALARIEQIWNMARHESDPYYRAGRPRA